MRSLLQFAAVLALFSFCGGTAVMVWDAHKVLRHFDSSLVRVEMWGSNEAQDVHQILADAKVATSAGAAFAQEQRKQLKKTSQDSDNLVRNSQVVLRNAEKLLYRFDQQLNGSILPHLDQELVATSTAAQLSFESLAHTSDTLTFQLNDPNISQMAEHLNTASFSIADASANTSDATKHLDHATADIEQDVHRLTRPPSMIKQIGMGILDAAAKLGSISAGFVK